MGGLASQWRKRRDISVIATDATFVITQLDDTTGNVVLPKSTKIT